jgi:hypothetical protein
MEKKSKGHAARIAVAVSAMLVASVAPAGPRYAVPGVTIVKNADGSGHFSGTLGGTRNSANAIERLSCSVSRSESNPAAPNPARSVFVSCGARDKNNVNASCFSSLETTADALAGLSNDGLLEVYWDVNGNCTSITVYESSSLERKR